MVCLSFALPFLELSAGKGYEPSCFPACPYGRPQGLRTPGRHPTQASFLHKVLSISSSPLPPEQHHGVAIPFFPTQLLLPCWGQERGWHAVQSLHVYPKELEPRLWLIEPGGEEGGGSPWTVFLQSELYCVSLFQ